jgi:hypothetical protein
VCGELLIYVENQQFATHRLEEMKVPGQSIKAFMRNPAFPLRMKSALAATPQATPSPNRLVLVRRFL